METLDSINFKEIARVTRQQRMHLNFDKEQVANALLTAYAAEVAERGQKLEERASGPKTNKLLHSIAEWLVDVTGKPSLLLYGEVGTGKTTALKAVCRVINACFRAENDRDRLSDYGSNVITIVRAKDVVAAYQDDRKLYEKMSNVNFIAIDELGVEAIDVKSYGNSNEPIIDLLSTRYDKQKFTAVSSNLDLDQISKRYGLRLADRFNEMFHKVGFVGSSYRGYAKPSTSM